MSEADFSGSKEAQKEAAKEEGEKSNQMEPQKASSEAKQDQKDADSVSTVSSKNSVKLSRSESLQQLSQSIKKVVHWTLTDFFDFNPTYCIKVRGILNLLHVILSFIAVCLLGSFCQLRPYPSGTSEGFFCKSPETFLFVMVCTTLIVSLVYLFCNLLSKRTDATLYNTSFEISYFIVFFVMLLTASITQLISSLNYDSSRETYYNSSKSPSLAGIFSIVNSLLYGLSAAWWFIGHRYHEEEESLQDAENPVTE